MFVTIGAARGSKMSRSRHTHSTVFVFRVQVGNVLGVTTCKEESESM